MKKFRLICEKDEKGLEKALKDHLYFSMKRMRHAIEVDYKDYLKKNRKKEGLSFDRPSFFGLLSFLWFITF